MILINRIKNKISSEQIFMLSVLLVNGGNYLYNVLMGRILGPEAFADAAILITFLLVLSFLAMTFQLTTAKFSVLFTGNVFANFKTKMYRSAIAFGFLIGLLIVVFSENLQQIFHTKTSTMFVIFGLAIPLYFMMSVNRGVFQGLKKFKSLSITYQSEMLSRLLITIVLILFLNGQSSVLIAIGIAISFFFGLIPIKKKDISLKTANVLSDKDKNRVLRFVVLTAFYECTQIIINNSDILLVKHYFDSYSAGLYASLALIGRVVYFVAWMFVMILLPTVVQKEKDGLPHAHVLTKYVLYISVLSASIVTGCYFFPNLIIELMFGNAYLAMSTLLWKYALATSLFAISNIFAYYFLSLDKYIPVIISGILGITQIVFIIFYHDSLNQVVVMQILAMTILLAIQGLYFTLKKK